MVSAQERLAAADCKVLVVDDEPLVLEGVRAILEHSDDAFVIKTATSRLEAIALVRQEAFDIVLLDLTMPGLAASDTHRSIRASHPDLPIVLMSGYRDTAAIEQLGSEPHTTFLPKPFTGDQLVAWVNGVLTAG